jgi:hypothetical protein
MQAQLRGEEGALSVEGAVLEIPTRDYSGIRRGTPSARHVGERIMSRTLSL